MAAADTYGSRRIARAPLAAVRRSAASTPLAEGVGETAGEGLTAIGGQVARAGVALVTGIAERERDMADQVARVKWQNQFAEFEKTRITDPEKGVLATQGEASFTLPEQIDAEWLEYTGKIEAGLRTDRQRLQFAADKLQFGSSVEGTVRRHVRDQIKTFTGEQLTARVANARSAAGMHAQDPRRVGMELTAGEEAIRTLAPKLGMGKDAVDSEVAKFRSATHVDVIQNLISGGQTKAANAYFQEAVAANQISGDTIDSVRATVRAGTVDAEGERAASAIWSELAPTNDTDPISLDVMETEARKRAGDDVDVLKATISALRSRKQGVDDGRKERMDGTLQTLYGAVLKGATWSQIRTMPEAVKNPALSLKIRDYLDTERAREESRAAAAESRAASRESRAWTATQRREAQLEVSGWARVRELTTPSALRNLTQGEIMAELPNIGRANVDRVLREWETRTKDDAALRQLKIDDDLFKDVASAGGITYAYRPPSELSQPQKANLGRLQAAVNDAVGQRSQILGRKLTPAEMREEMTSIVDQKVMLDDWFTDTEQTALVVNEADRAKAYVPFDRLPAGAKQDYTNYLRGEAPVSDAVRRQRMERAYALHLMGGTDAEVESVLKGAK